MPLVVFRTHAGSSIGLGHLRRCLTLARAVEGLGAECRFLVNRDPMVVALVRNQGLEGQLMDDGDSQDLRQTAGVLADWKADACVIDSYEVPGQCMAALKRGRVAVLDDLADRLLPVDLVVNGTPGATSLPYRTAPRTRLLLGPKYLLLREEFAAIQDHSINHRIERVLVTVGGMDPRAFTPKLVRWLRQILPQAALDVVMGPFFSRETAIEIQVLAASDPKVVLQVEPSAMHELMTRADLAVTGGGQTTYELAACGTPALAIRLVGNQTGNLQGLAAAGTLEWIGDAAAADLQSRVQAAVDKLATDPSAREAMSRAGRALVDGQGAQRIAAAIMEMCGQCV